MNTLQLLHEGIFRWGILNVWGSKDGIYTWIWKATFYPFLVVNNIAAEIYMCWGADVAMHSDAVSLEGMKIAIHVTCIWIVAPFVLEMYCAIGRFTRYAISGY